MILITKKQTLFLMTVLFIWPLNSAGITSSVAPEAIDMKSINNALNKIKKIIKEKNALINDKLVAAIDKQNIKLESIKDLCLQVSIENRATITSAFQKLTTSIERITHYPFDSISLRALTNSFYEFSADIGTLQKEQVRNKSVNALKNECKAFSRIWIHKLLKNKHFGLKRERVVLFGAKEGILYPLTFFLFPIILIGALAYAVSAT